MEVIKFQRINNNFVKGRFILHIPEDEIWISGLTLKKGKYGHYVDFPKLFSENGKPAEVVAFTKKTKDTITDLALKQLKSKK